MFSFPSFQDSSEAEEEAEPILERFRRIWLDSPPADIEEFIGGLGETATPYVVGMLAKIDLQFRFDRGDDVAARDYLDRYSVLASDGDRAISLIYEEFCLREERKENPDPHAFCERYPTWADSLASQLGYHRALSVGSGQQSHAPFPRPGDRFAKYSLDRVLGQGGHARVFLAHDDDLGGRSFVLKVSPDRGAEPLILGRMTHRNIIPVDSVEIEPTTGLRGLRMPYYPGQPLDVVADAIRKSGVPRKADGLLSFVVADGARPEADTPGWADFPRGESYARGVAWLGLRLAEALAHAHGAGTLHRDVKPANVLLSIQHGPQLLDFNLAKAPNSAEEAEVALRGGTVPYMAPEQLRAFQAPARWDDLGPGADIYALGLVLSELLTGDSPERPKSGLTLPRAIQEALDLRAAPRPPLWRRASGVPRTLSFIIDKCLAFDPADRYATAAELAEDLARFLDRRPPRNVVVDAPVEAARHWLERKGRGRKILVAAAICLPLLLYGGYRVRERIRIDAAVRLFDAKKYDEALAALFPLLDDYPGRFDLAVRAAFALEATGDRERANKLYEKAAGDPRAVDSLKRALAEHPETMSLAIALGHAQYAAKDFPEAIKTLRRVLDRKDLTRDPRRVGVHHALYVCEYETGRWADAVADMENVIRLRAFSGSGDEIALSTDLVGFFDAQIKAVARLAEADDPRTDAIYAQIRSGADELKTRLFRGRFVEIALRSYAGRLDLIRARMMNRKGDRIAAERALSSAKNERDAPQPLVETVHPQVSAFLNEFLKELRAAETVG